MTTVDPNFTQTADREARRARLFTRINTADKWFQVLGLAWITPLLKAAAGDNPQAQAKEVWRLLGVPLLAIAAFLLLWGTLAPKVQTSLGAVPGPVQVWQEVVNLHADAQAKADKKAKFEAMVLQTFLQSMLPKDTESVYGGGVAGEMWQSMLAEQLGNVMAKRGGIGIADRILSDHYREGEKIVPIQGVSSDQGKQERASSELLATAMVQEVQRSIATALDRELGPRAEADRR